MSKRMRICLSASLYDHACTGGAERQMALQAAGFAAAGHDVSVITLADADQDDITYTQSNGVTVHRIALRNLYFPFGAPKRSDLLRKIWHVIDVYNPAMGLALGKKLRQIAPDILITHKLQGLSVSAWRECKQLGICLVHALHDHELVCPATAMTRGEHLCEIPCLSCSALSSARHALASMPFAVIGPSNSIIERHRRFGWFGDLQRTAVLPNALPPDWPVSEPRTRCGTPLRVGYIGRIEVAKGIDTLLEATARLPHGMIKLMIAGDGEPHYVEALQQRFSGQLDLHFLGSRKASTFYPEIDLLVVPSRAHESFCNVVMEAASLGIPSIVSDRGALPERIGGGRYGWCFSAGDSHTLSRLIASCANDHSKILQTGHRAMETRNTHEYNAAMSHYLETLSGWLSEYRGAACA